MPHYLRQKVNFQSYPDCIYPHAPRFLFNFNMKSLLVTSICRTIPQHMTNPLTLYKSSFLPSRSTTLFSSGYHTPSSYCLHVMNCRLVSRNLLRLKPFLDANYAPLNDHHEYWFGMILLVKAKFQQLLLQTLCTFCFFCCLIFNHPLILWAGGLSK